MKQNTGWTKVGESAYKNLSCFKNRRIRSCSSLYYNVNFEQKQWKYDIFQKHPKRPKLGPLAPTSATWRNFGKACGWQEENKKKCKNLENCQKNDSYILTNGIFGMLSVWKSFLHQFLVKTLSSLVSETNGKKISGFKALFWNVMSTFTRISIFKTWVHGLTIFKTVRTETHLVAKLANLSKIKGQFWNLLVLQQDEFQYELS